MLAARPEKNQIAIWAINSADQLNKAANRRIHYAEEYLIKMGIKSKTIAVLQIKGVLKHLTWECEPGTAYPIVHAVILAEEPEMDSQSAAETTKNAKIGLACLRFVNQKGQMYHHVKHYAWALVDIQIALNYAIWLKLKNACAIQAVIPIVIVS